MVKRRTCRFIQVSLICTLIVLGTPLSIAQQSRLDNHIDTLLSILKRTLDVSQDIASFSKNYKGNDGAGETALTLGEVAGTSYDAVKSVTYLIELYSYVTCHTDRAAIRPVLTRRLNYYQEYIELQIEHVNGILAMTNSPTLVSYGNSLKTELRGVLTVLETPELKSASISNPATPSQNTRPSKPTPRNENSPFVATYVGGNRAPEVEVTNNSNRTLNLMLGSAELGDSHWQIPPHSKKRIELVPGDYTFKASAANVIPLEGEKDFQRGYVYHWTFYIETTTSPSRTKIPIPGRRRKRP